MKTVGYILILAGFLMLIVKGIDYTKKEKLVDAGPLEISVHEKKTLTWPLYAGVIAIIAGVTLVLLDRRR